MASLEYCARSYEASIIQGAECSDGSYPERREYEPGVLRLQENQIGLSDENLRSSAFDDGGAIWLEPGGGGVEVFEPEGEVEFLSGEVAAGDEAEDGVLDLGRKFGEGVAGAGASDGVELVEAEVVVEGGKGR